MLEQIHTSPKRSLTQSSFSTHRIGWNVARGSIGESEAMACVCSATSATYFCRERPFSFRTPPVTVTEPTHFLAETTHTWPPPMTTWSIFAKRLPGHFTS